jgi:predicted transcriptional regulator
MGRQSFFKARDRAGIVGVTFDDSRGTAVTRLALVGCTEAEIATLIGHSPRDVRSNLDAHHLHSDPCTRQKRLRKLETGTKTPNQAPK